MQYARTTIQSMIFIVAAAMSAAAQTAPASDQPDPTDLLKSVELAYGAINTYSAKVTQSVAMNGSDSQTNTEMAVSVTADSSGKFRLESTGMMGMVLVHDGDSTWMYFPAANSYSKLPISGGAKSAEAGAMGSGMFGGVSNALLSYKNVTANVKEAKVLRSEKLRVNGSDLDCWVISLEYGPWGTDVASQAAGVSPKDFEHSKTLWVDKNSYLVYREDSTMKMTMPKTNTPTNMKETSKIESITVNGTVSPDVFTFTPPPGATEIDESKFMPKTAEAPQTKN